MKTAVMAVKMETGGIDHFADINKMVGGGKMKAWIVSKKYGYCATIVFAETRGKAKSIALGTEPLEDAEFCSIEAKRAPEMDKYYKEGKTYMEWYDPEDRVAMVKDANFSCEYIEMSECETCQAREFCSNWEESEE